MPFASLNSWITSVQGFPTESELIITFGHRSNDRTIMTRDRPFIVARQTSRAGHKRAGGDELLCKSNSNAKKGKRQIMKAMFEKWRKGSKWSTRRYRGCDVISMPKEHTWSPSTALYVGSTKLTYNRSKTTGEIGLWVRQTREQATWSITLLVMFTKLR